MKMLARIVCILTILITPVASADTGDDVQTSGLFDQVRNAIPRLKTGMGYEEVCRILMTKKLSEAVSYGGLASCHNSFLFPGKADQGLWIDWHPSTSVGVVYKVELYDGKRRIAKFEADEK